MVNSFKEYWTCYGGYKSVIKSAYFWIAVIFSIISYQTWMTTGWENKFIGVFPSLLGFTLAGYAVWLTLGDQQLKSILSKKKNENNISLFMVINASFIHFIILQILAFIGILFLDTNSINHFSDFSNLNKCTIYQNIFKYLSHILNCFVFFLSIYSILSMLAAVFGLFNIAKAMDKLQT